MNKKIYIGIAGNARSGKNLFADIAAKILRERFNKTTKLYSLAYFLKKDCEPFLMEKFNLSVWSEKTEEKNMFRPFLVWYGDLMRKKSKGRYWIDKLNEQISRSDADVNIVTDIRYTTYDRDEDYWIKNEMNGYLIFLQKFTVEGGIKKYNPPANEHEKSNEASLKKSSDVVVSWQHVLKNEESYSDLLSNEYLNNTVSMCLNKLLK